MIWNHILADSESRPHMEKRLEFADQNRLKSVLPTLPKGEYLDSVLHLNHGLQNEISNDADKLVLTTTHLKLIWTQGRNRQTTTAAMDEISVVDIVEERSRFNGYVWGILAITVAALLWITVDNPIASITAAISVLIMGAYVIYARLSDAPTTRVTFKIGNTDLSCRLQGAHASEDIRAFVDRIFELKEYNRKRVATREWFLR